MGGTNYNDGRNMTVRRGSGFSRVWWGHGPLVRARNPGTTHTLNVPSFYPCCSGLISGGRETSQTRESCLTHLSPSLFQSKDWNPQTYVPLACETSLHEPKNQATPWAEVQQTIWWDEWDLFEPGINR